MPQTYQLTTRLKLTQRAALSCSMLCCRDSWLRGSRGHSGMPGLQSSDSKVQRTTRSTLQTAQGCRACPLSPSLSLSLSPPSLSLFSQP